MEKVIKASLDRFEGDLAVMYSNDVRKRKIDVPRSLVKARAGARVLIYIEEGHVTKVETDEVGTREAKQRIKDKYKMLRRGDHLNKQ